ncbi:MAG: RagB/SusD family nutrient uptake outer membrane protein [Tannerellaceae bacterium]|nr:RagB/SusD family nutrient uptake outer membrane protein [Tannerellaceae bacterium]
MKKIYMILVSCFMLSGCNESWLTPDPLSFYSPGNTLIDKEGMLSALTSCDRLLREEFIGQHCPLLTAMIFSELCVLGTTDISGPAQNMNEKILPNSNNNWDQTNRVFWYWEYDMLGIRYANTVITRIDHARFDSEEEKNNILGMALWHRAFRYYRLCLSFNDIPAVFTEVYSPVTNLYSVERDVILKRLKSDMELAAGYVSEQNYRGQISKGACYHLLAKICLALGNFDDAIKAAEAVINSGQYALMTSRFGVDANDETKNVLWDIHRPLNKNHPDNKEVLLATIDRYEYQIAKPSSLSLFMRNFVPFWANTTNRIQTPDGQPGMSDKRLTPPELDYNGIYGRGIGRCRLTWYTSNEVWDDPNDLRHAPGNWMRMEDLLYNNPDLKGSPYYHQPVRLWGDNHQLLCIDTLRNWGEWGHYKVYMEDPDNVTATQYNGGQADMYIMRLAETYLLRAEAYLWKDDPAAAAKDINAVRMRAGAAPLASAEVNMETLLDERTRELLYEENRKVELTRIALIYAKTGKPDYRGRTYLTETISKENYFYNRIMERGNFYNKGVKALNGAEFKISPYHIWWPIPQNDIDGNSSGRINQNEGYTGFELNIKPLSEIPASGISTKD